MFIISLVKFIIIKNFACNRNAGSETVSDQLKPPQIFWNFLTAVISIFSQPHSTGTSVAAYSPCCLNIIKIKKEVARVFKKLLDLYQTKRHIILLSIPSHNNIFPHSRSANPEQFYLLSDSRTKSKCNLKRTERGKKLRHGFLRLLDFQHQMVRIAQSLQATIFKYFVQSISVRCLHYPLNPRTDMLRQPAQMLTSLQSLENNSSHKNKPVQTSSRTPKLTKGISQ